MLYELLVEQALDDRRLAQRLLTRYGLEDADRAGYRQLVREALALGEGRHGFLDYRGAATAGQAIWGILDRAERSLAAGQPAEAIAIYQTVIEEVVPAMAHADDSMGALGDCLQVALAGMAEAAGELSPEGRKDLFAYCLAEATKEADAGWDWGWDLAEVAAGLVETGAQRDALFVTLDEMIEPEEHERWGTFQQQRAALIKLAVVRRQDEAPAVQAFLEAHNRHEQIRLALARFQMEQGRPDTARTIAGGWLAEAGGRWPGLQAEFRELLLEIAAEEGDGAEQIRQAEALFLTTGRLADYERVKGLVGAEGWAAYRPGFLERVEATGRYINMGALYEAEEMWETLLAYVQAQPHAAASFHRALAGRFPRELAAVYEQLARATLQQKVNRKGYREACRYLRQMEALGEGARVRALVAEWREVYARRPALLDELGRAFGG